MNKSPALYAFVMFSAACGGGGGPVAGPADQHCGDTVVEVEPAACDEAVPHDHDEEEPATMYGNSGDDDDCKYHVTFTASDIQKNKDVTFTLQLTSKADGTPVAGATPFAEVFLSDVHPAPNSQQHSTEPTAGSYTVGPVRFDASGRWTTRFHFFDDCADAETSPHGHAAFFIEVF